MGWTIERVREQAARVGDAFAERVRAIPYEDKGVLYSEMLFLVAAAGQVEPRHIAESGRARGQSTHLLAVCFPAATIHSIERERESPDVGVTSERLARLPNVRQLFGDAFSLLSPGTVPGDMERIPPGRQLTLIDGPKGWRSLRLAFEELRRGVPLVFVHDCFRGSPERRFLERHLPGALFSDDTAFVAAWRHLDEPAWRALGKRRTPGWRPFELDGRPMESYGPTLACLPCDPRHDYGALLRRLGWTSVRTRLWRSVRKRLFGQQTS